MLYRAIFFNNVYLWLHEVDETENTGSRLDLGYKPTRKLNTSNFINACLFYPHLLKGNIYFHLLFLFSFVGVD